MKHNRRFQLREKQEYIGQRSTVSEDINKIIDKILNGEVDIPPRLPITSITKNIYARVDQEKMNQLAVIAEQHHISVNELLRLGMEQNNLVSTPQK